MAGLLRRLRRPKEAEPEPEPEVAPVEDEAPEPAPAPEGPSSEEVPAEPVVLPEPAEPAVPAPPEGPVGPPPPLPEADREAARSSIARRRPQSKCFLCGSDLDGPWCPTCRMAWSD